MPSMIEYFDRIIKAKQERGELPPDEASAEPVQAAEAGQTENSGTGKRRRSTPDPAPEQV